MSRNQPTKRAQEIKSFLDSIPVEQRQNIIECLEEEMCIRLKTIGFDGDKQSLLFIAKTRMATMHKRLTNEVWFVLDPNKSSQQYIVGFDYKRLKILRIIGKK